MTTQGDNISKRDLQIVNIAVGTSLSLLPKGTDTRAILAVLLDYVEEALLHCTVSKNTGLATEEAIRGTYKVAAESTLEAYSAMKMASDPNRAYLGEVEGNA